MVLGWFHVCIFKNKTKKPKNLLSIYVNLFCDMTFFRKKVCCLPFSLSSSVVYPAEQSLHDHTFQNESSSFSLVKRWLCVLFLTEFPKSSRASIELNLGCCQTFQDTETLTAACVKRLVSSHPPGGLQASFV